MPANARSKMPPQRRFRRVPLHRHAEMEVHQPLRGPQGAVPVTIRSITCEGAGLGLPESWKQSLRRGDPVTVRFATDDHPMMELPGQVAWYDGPTRASNLHVGVRFHLLSAGPEVVGRYADWIVDLITAVTRHELELGAVLVRVAGLPLRTLQQAIETQRRIGKPLADVLLHMRAVSDYDLRLAAHCQLSQPATTVPVGLLQWKNELRAAIGAS